LHRPGLLDERTLAVNNTVPIPDPVEAAQLRALFAGNQIIERIVATLAPFVGDVDCQVHGPDGEPWSRAEAAAALLPMWKYFAEMTEREARGVVAFFVADQQGGAR